MIQKNCNPIEWHRFCPLVSACSRVIDFYKVKLMTMISYFQKGSEQVLVVKHKDQFFLAKKVSILLCTQFDAQLLQLSLQKSHQVSWQERFRSQAEDELKLRMAKAAAGPLSFYSFLASLETGNLECFTWFKLQSQREVFMKIWIFPHSYEDLKTSDLLIFLTSKTDQKGIAILHSSSSGHFQGFIRLP